MNKKLYLLIIAWCMVGTVWGKFWQSSKQKVNAYQTYIAVLLIDQATSTLHVKGFITQQQFDAFVTLAKAGKLSVEQEALLDFTYVPFVIMLVNGSIVIKTASQVVGKHPREALQNKRGDDDDSLYDDSMYGDLKLLWHDGLTLGEYGIKFVWHLGKLSYKIGRFFAPYVQGAFTDLYNAALKKHGNQESLEEEDNEIKEGEVDEKISTQLVSGGA